MLPVPGKEAAECRAGVAVLWGKAPEWARVRVRHGGLSGLKVEQDGGRADNSSASFAKNIPARLHIEFRNAKDGLGFPAAVVSLETPPGSFSFFLRDVTSSRPIFIPRYNAAVVPAGDPRGFEQVAEDVRLGAGLTKLQRINLEPEEDYDSAAAATRRISGHTTLGLGRDFRLFNINSYGRDRAGAATVISPKLASRRVTIPETGWKELAYLLNVSRGIGCAFTFERRLEDGSLPILNQRLTDEDIIYDTTFFCSLKNRPLISSAVRGTHFLVGDGYSGGHRFAGPEQEQAFLELLAEETSRAPEETWQDLFPSGLSTGSAPEGENARARFIEHCNNAPQRREEETILVCRLRAFNGSSVPRYAWFAAPIPLYLEAGMHKICTNTSQKEGGICGYDPETGFGSFESGRVFCVARMNGRPLPNAEMAVLLQPGACVSAEFLIPHRPVDLPRAGKLACQSAVKHHEGCRKYWLEKLEGEASIEVPERRIQEMLRACRLHLDMVMYGREPGGVLAPSCGRSYAALAPESAPMIQFLDSVGRHDIARRALDFFLEKQHAGGMMQNFDEHQSEPGAVLQMFAEHFRFTHDEAWLGERAQRLLKTADYLIGWRKPNLREELRGRGYGLISGQMADMKETLRGFSLNGQACLGLLSFAEVLSGVMPAEAERLEKEALSWKRDLLEAVTRSMESAPVMPLGNGTWTPSIPAGPEKALPACLDGSRACETHGTFLTRDNAWPSKLVFCGLLEPDDALAGMILEYVTEIFHVRNVRHSQPYISWHPWIHLRRGEVKAFLKSYYNTLASLADRETYTFREHYYGACPHKTEADGAFLMQTRWMLWLEEGRTLSLLPGVPRAWLRDGLVIRLSRAASYFGKISLEVRSNTGRRFIRANYELTGGRLPESIRLRLPHPSGFHPCRVGGGVFNPGTESVIICNPARKGDVRLEY